MTDDRKFVFVKNSKAGCTTIAQLMYHYCHGKFFKGSVHRTRDGLRQGITYWMDYETASLSRSAFTFTFVRHPETRLLSAFKNFFVDWKNRSARIHFHSLRRRGFDEAGELARNFDVFLDYVDESLSKDALRTDRHWRLQVLNTGYGLIDYQFIGKVENFDRDIQEVFSLAGVPAPPTKDCLAIRFNRSAHHDFTISKTQRRRIERLFAEDYEAFGYEPNLRGLE
jgi:hypothetical protein